MPCVVPKTNQWFRKPAEMHYFKRNIGDYAKKAGKLSMLQHGAYTLLMDACYDRERFPTLEDALDWCWASTDDEISAVKFVLGKFFELVDGKYTQARVQEEIDDFHGKSAVNRRIALEREENRRNSARSVIDKARNVDAPSPARHEAPPNQEPLTTNQEPGTKKTDVAPSAPAGPSADVLLVFEFWKTAMKSPRSLLDDKRKGLIKRALKTGYSVEQLCQAIEGCTKSSFHMGDNEKGAKYNGLDLILRDAEKIDTFIVIGQSPRIPRRTDGTPKVSHDLSTMNYDRAPDDYTF